jgi:hypothetical protein
MSLRVQYCDKIAFRLSPQTQRKIAFDGQAMKMEFGELNTKQRKVKIGEATLATQIRRQGNGSVCSHEDFGP